jgi:hypothetical protein
MVLRSQNGFPANDRSQIGVFQVPGTSTRLALRKGNVATVLLYVASEFDKCVEDIDTPSSRGYVKDDLNAEGSSPSTVFDDWSFAVRMVRGSSTSMSNHASGSAIDLNATQHPLGTTGNFTSHQRAVIRRILKDCGGVVRWGGDYVSRKDPMHFEINASPARVAVVAARLRRQARAEVAAKKKAERAAAAKVRARRKKATAAAKAKALLLENKRKAAAAAAAAALAAIAAGGTAVVNDGSDSPAPVPSVTATATVSPTPSGTPTATVTPKPSATRSPVKTPASKPVPVLRRTLRYAPGEPFMHGADVRRVQKLVGAKVDDDLGPASTAAIRRWQANHDLRQTGTFGKIEARKAGWRWVPR